MQSKFGDQFMPRRATKFSAGYDLYMPCEMMCRPGLIGKKVYEINTGIRLEEGDIPQYSVGFIFPRSSVGSKYGLKFLNTTGVIDSDYRGYIHLWFTVEKAVHFDKGDRIAQIVFVPYTMVANEIEPTEERNGGTGSTGVGL